MKAKKNTVDKIIVANLISSITLLGIGAAFSNLVFLLIAYVWLILTLIGAIIWINIRSIL